MPQRYELFLKPPNVWGEFTQKVLLWTDFSGLAFLSVSVRVCPLHFLALTLYLFNGGVWGGIERRGQINKVYAHDTISIRLTLLFLFWGAAPIHVHVENSDGRAKFVLEPVVELLKNEGIKPKDLRKAKALCETFQEDFIMKWHEHVDQKEWWLWKR